LILQIEQRPSVQYPIEIMDDVDFTSTTLEIDCNTYFVFGLDHEWKDEGGQSVITTLYLHQAYWAFMDDAVTASPVEEAPVPLSYNNPAGDPFNNPDFTDDLGDAIEDLLDTDTDLLDALNNITASNLANLQVSAHLASISSNYINWGGGSADISISNVSTPLIDSNGMFGQPPDRFSCSIAGKYICLLGVSNETDVSETAALYTEIQVFNSSNTLISSSGLAWQYHSGLPAEYSVHALSTNNHLMVDLAVSDYIKCYCVILNGTIDAIFQCYKIG